MNASARTLEVAAVQMQSKDCAVGENLERATGFLEAAVGRGAELVLFPEFMPTGYVYTDEIWNAGEPSEGPTVKWLRENSRRLGVWLGTSFLEADGEDFFNTFVLTDPDGSEGGRVRKQRPAFAEAHFFKGEVGPHVLDTELGRIGVSICYENWLADVIRTLHSQSPDILLMPLSAPSPTPHLFFPNRYIVSFNENIRSIAANNNEILGVPVVMANKSGPWVTPLPGLPFTPQYSTFPGYSTIVDSGGTVKAQMGDEEGLIVGEVTLDPTRKREEPPRFRGRWAMKLPWAINIFRFMETSGGFYYRMRSKRRSKAREISSQSA